jgi:hypothetical protein
MSELTCHKDAVRSSCHDVGARSLTLRTGGLRLALMKRLSSSTIVASLLASVALAAVAPAFAAPLDASPQCGGEKDEKSGTNKPAPAPAPAPKPPA